METELLVRIIDLAESWGLEKTPSPSDSGEIYMAKKAELFKQAYNAIVETVLATGK